MAIGRDNPFKKSITEIYRNGQAKVVTLLTIVLFMCLINPDDEELVGEGRGRCHHGSAAVHWVKTS
jgi:hypothetical protein